MDFPGRLIVGFTAVILVILFPMQYIAQLNNETIDSLVEDRTRTLTDAICDKGYLDVSMYEQYVNFLDTTGEQYDIEIEDIHPVTGDAISLQSNKEFSLTNMNEKAIPQVRLYYQAEMRSTLLNTNAVIQSFEAHTHTNDCYAGHRHDATCSGFPMVYYRKSLYDDNEIKISCGYCKKEFYSIRVYTWYSTDFVVIRVNSSTIYQYIRSTDPVNYEKYRSQFYTLRSQLDKYQTYSSGSEVYGYVPASQNNIELPILGKVDKCNYNCNGIPLDIQVAGGWNHDIYNSASIYTFVCKYCNKKIMEAEDRGSINYRAVTVYKNNQVLAVYTDKNLINPFFTSIGSLPRNSEGYVSVILNRNASLFNYSFLSEAINHGCVYPQPSCQLAEDTTPICNQVIASITATNPNQTVTKGGIIITTATATYLDGYTGMVNCSSNFNTNLIGTQTVTLTYTGLVGNAKTAGTRTCTITVTVNPSRTLSSITVTPVNQTIYRYGTPAFTIKANYSDGTSKTLLSGQYTMTGFNPSVLGEQQVTFSYTEGTITKTAYVKVNVTALKMTCPRCGTVYNLNQDDSDPGCPICKELVTEIIVSPDYVEIHQGDPLPITVKAVYKDGTMKTVYDWTSNLNPNALGLQMVTVEYRGLGASLSVWVNEREQTCPICGTVYPISEPNCPVCASKVMSITVSPKELTVRQYEPIILTVTAYYTDGSNSIVEDWSIDRNTAEAGTFVASIKYGGEAETITLTVIPLSAVECPICGLIYEPSENIKGCPVCSETITSIEAYLTTGTNLVQLGTYPSIAVVLIFRDEHREIATKEHTLENYNPNIFGIQTVIVRYETFSTTVEIEVVNSLTLVTCPNGHMYYLNDDLSDPGCPFCHKTGEHVVIYYFDITYINEILDQVYREGAYYFEEGNFISMKVTKKDVSLLSNMQRMFFKTSMLGRKKRFVFGGEIS